MGRILVLDDDIRVSRALTLVLESEGYEVTTAGDGQAGLGLLGRGEFDVLIVDVFMPGADGLETIRAVRKQLPNLPIIVMSGLQSGRIGVTHAVTVPDFLSIALQFGASFALQKPFRPDELLRTIKTCIGGAGSGAPSERHLGIDGASERQTG